ncbi:MAG: hypothetical protein Q4G26_15640 [Paracoccus sp. (in: a-proteobacteria)]|nr:hypothetical protein [Paracoccus sp. (in: a-proteobacteria)]
MTSRWFSVEYFWWSVDIWTQATAGTSISGGPSLFAELIDYQLLKRLFIAIPSKFIQSARRFGWIPSSM